MKDQRGLRLEKSPVNKICNHIDKLDEEEGFRKKKNPPIFIDLKKVN